MHATPTTLDNGTAIAATVTPSAYAVSVTRTSDKGKVTTLHLERALTKSTRNERETLQARIYSVQLSQGMYRPFTRDVLAVFGATSEKLAFHAGIAARGPIDRDSFAALVAALVGAQFGKTLKGEKLRYFSMLQELNNM